MSVFFNFIKNLNFVSEYLSFGRNLFGFSILTHTFEVSILLHKNSSERKSWVVGFKKQIWVAGLGNRFWGGGIPGKKSWVAGFVNKNGIRERKQPIFVLELKS